MPIKGLSEQRVLPRLGKIKLGVFVQTGGTNAAGKPKGYPKATDYFVCPPEVEKVYGEKPKELPVTFLVNDLDRVFPQDLKAYKSFGLWCKGDGETAKRWDEAGHLVDRPCPCELLDAGDCKPVATLNVALTAVPGLGVYQVVTRSPNAIKQINSALAQTAAAVGGIRGVRFLLKLREEEVPRFDEKTKSMVRTKIHVPFLTTAASLDDVLAQRKALGAGVDPLMLMPGPADPEPDDAPDGEPTPPPPDPVLPATGSAIEARRVENLPPPVDRSAIDAVGEKVLDAARAAAPPPILPEEESGEPEAEKTLLDECYELAGQLDVDAATYKAYLTVTRGGPDLSPEQAEGEIERLRTALQGQHGRAAAKAAMRAGARRLTARGQGNLV